MIHSFPNVEVVSEQAVLLNEDVMKQYFPSSNFGR